jgi:phosphatidyl-myo-inositol dimannoside synthase
MTEITCSAPARMLILTPSLDGRDGLSCLARQVVDAVRSSFSDIVLDVWVLAPAAPGGDGIRISSALNQRSTLIGWSLAQACQPTTPDVVLVLHLHLLPLAWPLAARGVPVVPFLIGIESWRQLRGTRAMALRRARVAVAISSHTERAFRQSNPSFAGLQVEVCHPATPMLADAAAQPEAGPPFALIVGRLAADERYKGHDLLLDAWPAVERLVPGAALVVAGGGDDEARLRARVAAEGLQHAVTFTGTLDPQALASLYRNCTMFVLPSRGEGFGLVLLEAMSAGRACIAAPGAAEEIVEHGITGLIVDPDDHDAMVAAIARLFTNAALTQRFGAAGQVRAREVFGVERFVRDLTTILAPLVHPRSAVSPC